MRTKTLSGWVELDTDPLDWIDMVLAKCIEGRTCVRHLKRNVMRVPNQKARNFGNRILGLSLLDSDWDLGGPRNWLLPNNWKDRLKRAGIDPDTLEIVCPPLWDATLMRLGTADYVKKRDAAQGKKVNQTRAAVDILPIERMTANSERPPAAEATEEQIERDGWSFGAPLKQSRSEFYSQKEIVSGPPHRPRRRLESSF